MFQIYQEYLQHCNLQKFPDENTVTFYEPNNSGPQASLGKALDIPSIHVWLPTATLCTTACLFLEVIGLVEYFFKKHCLDIACYH